MLRRLLAAVLATTIAAIIAPISATGPAAAGKAVLNLVLVLDGMRPDSITASETPNSSRSGRA